ncbi:vacuolar atpase assembly integral membrane protein vma21 [Malassezia pachydermatis]|uniref:Vacuolar atpase assembly integral membrane protein vma21 n=1 Tax=Malassezia pachydermatis TaxID=77020 RepID=A0A0M8MYV9_9BASI|nr:vacuolar atpase assembly integral membrane protein vma21 [Malassezia pachydermatis]KOS16490.1 vacuolar atpase assembly integral membrane protein vma21 [Malassezia pachydermatis]
MSIPVTPSRVGKPGPDPAKRVYFKLAFFSVSLFVAPIAAYYYSKDRWFGGDAVYSGGLAALVANVVLFGYIVTACLEDDGSKAEAKRQEKKSE